MRRLAINDALVVLAVCTWLAVAERTVSGVLIRSVEVGNVLQNNDCTGKINCPASVGGCTGCTSVSQTGSCEQANDDCGWSSTKCGGTDSSGNPCGCQFGSC